MHGQKTQLFIALTSPAMKLIPEEQSMHGQKSQLFISSDVTRQETYTWRTAYALQEDPAVH